MSPTQSQLSRWNKAVGALFYTLDSDQFPRYLMDALNEIVEVEAVLLTLERRGEIPTLLYDQDIPNALRKVHIDSYFSGAYLLDPFCIAFSAGLAPGFYHLSEIAPDDFYQSDYYRTYYKDASLVDDAYYTVALGEDVQFSLSIGRLEPHSPFTRDELNQLRDLNPIVQGAMLRYWKTVIEPRPRTKPVNLRHQVESAFHNFGRSVLTEREREVALLLLRGHSSKSAAKELDISPDTAQMHRKNLYRKLGLSSQSELFSLFITVLSQADST